MPQMQSVKYLYSGYLRSMLNKSGRVVPSPVSRKNKSGRVVPSPMSGLVDSARMTEPIAPEIKAKLQALSQVPQLLVACDFDGTLAPLVDNPMEAKPLRESSTAIRTLAELANTSVTIVSGRSLRDLATLSRFPEEIRLVGSHGSEFDATFTDTLTPSKLALKEQIVAATREIASKYSARVEVKPAGIAFHVRELEDSVKEAALNDMRNGPCLTKGVRVMEGSNVIELSVHDRNKGHALDKLRSLVGASAVIYMGDDTTDEDAFATLSGPDMSIKVGEGETAAEFRVTGPEAVAQVLAVLTELRSDWLAGAALEPIQHHSIISDQRTAAIITPQARITWFCAPRIDSGSIFAELVGGPNAGYFAIIDPAGEAVSQSYEENTLLLTTEFPNFTVTDFMDTSSGRTKRLAGRSDLVRKIEGSGPVQIEFVPRLNFARSFTDLVIKDDGLVITGNNDLVSLRSPGVSWEIHNTGNHQTAIGTATLVEGEPLFVELRYGSASLKPSSTDLIDRLNETSSFWERWAAKLILPELAQEQVQRSALILRSLYHRPTGAFLAAATTSLPETLGGVRNWDYRYCWLRDAALTAASLVRLGAHSEAMGYLDWVLRLLENRSDPERLSPLYNVAGRHLPPEAELTDMPGYGGSRPVRIGNAADGQVQLDVFGPVVDLVYLLAEAGEPLSAEHWRLVQAMVTAVERRWHETDHGIWEIRKPPRPHVYTKTMCWVTIDRAIKVADSFMDEAPAEWIKLRDEIRDEVLSQGWSDERNTFTAAYGSTDLDSSVLAVGMWGLIDPQDERFVATVDAVEKDLRNGKTVYRYIEDDGLPGKEGGFNIMTTWLIESMHLVGRSTDAKALFNDYLTLVGNTGLMAEEYEPDTDMALGNVPQAYSHLGLINNAVLLSSGH